MGEDDPLVDPADGGRVALQVELAGRQHDLSLDVVDDVPIRVDVGEVVVAADGLELVEGHAEWPVVPQSRASERVGLGFDVGLGQDVLAAKLALAPAVKPKCQPGHRDVVADIALFLGVLVRDDREPLDGFRVEAPDQQRGEEPYRDREPERPEHPGERAADKEGGRQPRDHGQDVVREELGVLVGEADAVGDPASAVDELVLVELVAKRHRQQEEPGQHGQVHANRRREHEPAARCADEILRGGEQQGRDHEAVEQPLDEPQERQLEEEEPDVAPEDRVG